MTILVHSITIDCADWTRLVEFWAVLADPEGNEFCVERSAGERGQ